MAEDEADLIEIDMAELKKMKVGQMSMKDMSYRFRRVSCPRGCRSEEEGN